jgi:serine/threonine protein phosphatase 1
MFSKAINGPVAVIGDVHGQTDKLASILEQLEALPDYQQRWIVFIGDLVDRGPDSRGSIDAVLRLMESHSKTTVCAGNHELAMAGALGLIDAPGYASWNKRWLAGFGAEATFESYGVKFGDSDALRKALPAGHAEVIADSPWCVEHPDLFFVHAGLDPYMPFAAQRAALVERDFTLNSPGWLFSKRWPFEALPPDCNKVVISGHVPVPKVLLERQRILVDTTGGVSGDLSCVLMPERRVIQSAGRSATRRPFLSMSRLFGRRVAAF